MRTDHRENALEGIRVTCDPDGALVGSKQDILAAAQVFAIIYAGDRIAELVDRIDRGFRVSRGDDGFGVYVDF